MPISTDFPNRAEINAAYDESFERCESSEATVDSLKCDILKITNDFQISQDENILVHNSNALLNASISTLKTDCQIATRETSDVN